MNRVTSRTMPPSHRRGAAFFVLILAVVLVVVGAMMTLVRSEWSSAIRQRERFRIETMNRAIEAVATRDIKSPENTTLSLPIDSKNGERIEVTVGVSPEDKRIYTARWLRGNQLLDMLARTVTDKTNDEVEENNGKP